MPVLPVLTLTTGVVLPQMVLTIAAESDEARAAVAAAMEADRRLLLLPKVGDRHARVGTVAVIEDSGDLPSGGRGILVRGLARARVGAARPNGDSALHVEAQPLGEPSPSERAHEMAREYKAVVESVLEHRGASRLIEGLRGIDDPGVVADTAGYSPDVTFEQKVELLEAVDVEERLDKALGWMRDTLAELSLKDKVRRDVTEGMEKTQREFMLRQQLEAIRKELGEDDDVVAEYRARMDTADLPDDVAEAVERELGRLEKTSEQSAEHGWIRSWLDTIFEIPWGTLSEEHLDVSAARDVLDADHTGLDDVKERILEFLAVRKLRSDRGREQEGGRGSGAIIALVGPPGVGKTSLGESVARALGREFVRVSLGGVRDEAEVRGHRRTYVGAQPGRIARALREAGTMNPVFMLDEVDKLQPGAFSGDPSAALLEVLDPAQNHSFRDHYLEVELDLSHVLFIATANVVDTIPGPLLDRLEVVRLDGYTEDDKVAIARNHLLERQIERNGLDDDEVTVDDDALRGIVLDYTREAGVRNLEREIGTVLRKVATRIAAGDDTPPVSVGRGDLPDLLGRPKFFNEVVDRTANPGVATGLAVTGVGGDVLFVEASVMPGDGGTGAGSFTLTGQLGDVMSESAQIAQSYVRSHGDALGLDADGFAGKRFHLHVPSGAVPKDGPSAGITMTTALVSLLSGRRVRSDVGMTGEVTLQGRVLPIGGVKQKVLAAHRAGLREVILPARNEGDLDDVPEAVAAEMTFHTVDDVADVLGIALEPATVEDAAA
ncbi:MAG: endopeptidase La [Acidimicrobiia bacterium]